MEAERFGGTLSHMGYGAGVFDGDDYKKVVEQYWASVKSWISERWMLLMWERDGTMAPIERADR